MTDPLETLRTLRLRAEEQAEEHLRARVAALADARTAQATRDDAARAAAVRAREALRAGSPVIAADAQAAEGFRRRRRDEAQRAADEAERHRRTELARAEADAAEARAAHARARQEREALDKELERKRANARREQDRRAEDAADDLTQAAFARRTNPR